LVVPYDEKSLSNALARLVDDQELRAELSESGLRLLSAEFSWEPLITRLENMYRDSMIKTRRSNTVG
jgi:glycosyltransferase involved in cell wall biosynthesis